MRVGWLMGMKNGRYPMGYESITNQRCYSSDHRRHTRQTAERASLGGIFPAKIHREQEKRNKQSEERVDLQKTG